MSRPAWLNFALLGLDRNAGVIAHALVHAGKGVEQRGLAGVGVTDQGDQRRLESNHARSGERGDTDSGGLVATETQSIIAEADLHGIAEGSERKHFDFPRLP